MVQQLLKFEQYIRFPTLIIQYFAKEVYIYVHTPTYPNSIFNEVEYTILKYIRAANVKYCRIGKIDGYVRASQRLSDTKAFITEKSMK